MAVDVGGDEYKSPVSTVKLRTVPGKVVLSDAGSVRSRRSFSGSMKSERTGSEVMYASSLFSGGSGVTTPRAVEKYMPGPEESAWRGGVRL